MAAVWFDNQNTRGMDNSLALSLRFFPVTELGLRMAGGR